MSAPHSDAPAAPRRFQFNLATLLLVTAWIAVTCVALRTPTVAWAGAIFCLALLALATSLLATIYRTEASRAFAVGFLVCGLGYATCLFFVEHKFTGQFEAPAAMPTTRMAEWLFTKLHSNSVQTITVPAGGPGGGMGGGGFGGSGGMFSVDSSEQAVQAGVSADETAPGDGSVPSGASEGAAADPGAGGEGDASAGMYGGMGGSGMGMPMMGGMPGMGGAPGGMGPGMGGTMTVPLYDSTTFTNIVHCTLTILLGILGGIIARWLYATGQRKPSPSRSGAN